MKDDLVAPRKQRDLARRLSAPTFEVAGDHSAVSAVAPLFNRALLAALADVVSRGAGSGRADAATA
jgi:hypothetical protein